MRTEGGNRQPVDWADLVAGIRAGDEEAILRLGDIFQGGIRYFLRRGLGQRKLESRQREVLSLVIQSIRETSIDDPNRLASYVLTVLRQYIGSQITAGPHLVSENETPVNIKSVGPSENCSVRSLTWIERPCTDITWTRKHESKYAGR